MKLLFIAKFDCRERRRENIQVLELQRRKDSIGYLCSPCLDLPSVMSEALDMK